MAEIKNNKKYTVSPQCIERVCVYQLLSCLKYERCCRLERGRRGGEREQTISRLCIPTRRIESNQSRKVFAGGRQQFTFSIP